MPRGPQLLLVLAAAVLVAGCGGSDRQQVVSELTPAKAVAAAASKSAAAASQRSSLVAKLDGDEVMSMELASSSDGRQARGTMHIAGLGDIDTLRVDGASYYAFPSLPDGVRWVQVDDSRLEELGLNVDAAQGQSGSNALALLSNVAKVREVGAGRVNGADATHYEVTIDQRKVSKANGVLSGEALEQSIALLGETFTADLWIDDDGFVRRMEYSADLSAATDLPAGMPDSGELTYRFDLEGYGDPIDVEAPAPSEVTTYEQLLGDTAGEGN